jgi:hypothetical protein
MKNTLWTFGCSFTAEYHPVGDYYRSNYDDYKEWRGGNLPPVWPTILSEKLKMNLVNKGKGATGNSTIFRNFCNSTDDIKKGDVVIIGWSRMLRYNLAAPDGTWMMDILPSMQYSEHPKDILDYITVNRSLEPWMYDIVSYIKIATNYCKLIGADLFFWTSDDTMYKILYKLYPELDTNKFIDWDSESLIGYIHTKSNENSKFVIKHETNGEVDDQHMGEIGHRYQSDIIFKHLIKHGVNI